MLGVACMQTLSGIIVGAFEPLAGGARTETAYRALFAVLTLVLVAALAIYSRSQDVKPSDEMRARSGGVERLRLNRAVDPAISTHRRRTAAKRANEPLPGACKRGTRMSFEIVAEKETETVRMKRASSLVALAKARVWTSEGWKVTIMTDNADAAALVAEFAPLPAEAAA